MDESLEETFEMFFRRRRRFDRVITRLLLLSGVPLLVYGAIGLFVYQTEIAPLLVEQLLSDLRVENSADTAIIEAWVTEQQSIVRYLASRPETRELTVSAVLPEARRVVGSFANLGAIVLANSDGEVIVDSNVGSGGNVSYRSYFREALAGRSVVSDVIVARNTGSPMVIFAEPVISPQGETAGVLFAPVRPTVLNQALRPGGTGTAGSSFVIDSKRRLVSSGQTLKAVGPEALPQGEYREAYRSHRGVSVYGVSTSLRAADWTVVTEAPSSSITKGFARYNRILATGAFAALVVAAVAAVLLGAAIEVPIKRLEELSRKIGSIGSAGAAAQLRITWAPQELRQLRDTLVSMAGQIEERQAKLEKNNELLEGTQEMAMLGSWEFYAEKAVLRWSRTTNRILGLDESRKELDLAVAISVIHPEDRPHFRRAYVLSLLRGKAEFEIEHRVIKADNGEVRFVFQRCRHERDSKGAVTRTVGMVHDVTERHQFETSLQDALAEKTLLLRELNHRVRNNLAVMQGILSLQRRHLSEPSREHSVLSDVESRLTSMALIHEQLYQARNGALISLEEYVDELVARIRETHGRPDVELRSSTQPVTLHADRGIPCGIILNELLINAYKHAFPGRGGSIEVMVRHTADGHVELMVTDDGVGLPSESEQSRGMGMDLIGELSRQLDGTIEYRRGAGTEVRVRFVALPTAHH